MDDNKVAVLIEQLMSQFKIFGEGRDGLREELINFKEETNQRLSNIEQGLTDLRVENNLEHQQLRLMIKELDHEVQVELKRVK